MATAHFRTVARRLALRSYIAVFSRVPGAGWGVVFAQVALSGLKRARS